MQHWSQLIVVLIAFGAPAASWAFTKLREQYEKKRKADQSRAREEESIRVQRSAERLDQPSPQAQIQRRMEELAAKRRAQLEELRKRRAGGTGSAPEQRPVVVLAPTAPTTPRVPQQGPMRPGVPGAPTRIPIPATPRPTAPQSGQRPTRPPVQPAPQRQRVQSRPTPTRADAAPTQAQRADTPTKAPQVAPRVAPMTGPQRRASAAAMTPGAQARALLRGSDGSTARTMATAIALSEILAKPVSLRGSTFEGRGWN